MRWFPFVSRRQAEQVIAHSAEAVDRASQLQDRNEAALKTTRRLLTEMHEGHSPYPGRWADLGHHVGSEKPAEWWCKSCRTPWPCRTWRQVRRVYSATFADGEVPDEVPELEIVVRAKETPPTRPAGHATSAGNG